MKKIYALSTLKYMIPLVTALFAKQTLAQPTITSFAPASGPIGTEVTITGTNFSSTPANNIIYFGAVKSPVIAATTTTLKVNVPIGTTYEPITVTANGLTAYSAKPFLVTFASVAGHFTENSFSAHIDFETGIYATDNHISDFDGDGKADIIVSDYDGPHLTILKNESTNGKITFGALINLNTSGIARACFVGDFDGDGRQDVGAASYTTNTISVFRNKSSIDNIAFGSKVDFATSVGPHYAAIGDLDRDGKPDIVITNPGSASISIFRNTSTTGTISFASKIDFTIGTTSVPFGCAMGDLDGDGKPEIVVGNRGVGYISIFRNISTSGHISLAPRMDINISIEKAPNGVSIGDLDGDGKSDVVVANFGEDFKPAWVSILRNTSMAGALSFEKNTDFLTGGAGCHWASITDLDGDGKPDLVADNYWDGVLSLFKNTSTTGHISFDKPTLLTAGSGPNHPQISDLDGDKKPDIEVANIFSQRVSAFRNLITPALSIVLSCPKNKVVSTDQGVCRAKVNDIDPILTPAGSTAEVIYTLTGATTGSGSRSASGNAFNKGITTVTYTLASDATQTCSLTVNVKDKEAPVITGVSATPSILWPPNHKMKEVAINYALSDNCGATASLSIKSNEGSSSDGQVVDAHHVRLRAERSGTGHGRIYTILITATDASGNKRTQTAQVVVPHDRGDKKYGWKDEIDDLKVEVLPNPSQQYFTLLLQSTSTKPVTVRVINTLGKVVEVRSRTASNGTLQLGNSYGAGVYVAELIQGNRRVVVKLVKTSQ